MIPDYIKNWLDIIEGMNNTNTYKLAWGRAIIESVEFDDFIEHEDKCIITFDSISKKMLKYYWNQLFFFNLKQSPDKDKLPIICNDTLKLIELYKIKNDTTIPVWFDEGLDFFVKKELDVYNIIISHISKTLHNDVSWRFLNVSGKIVPLYDLNKKESLVIIDANNIKDIKEYSIIISKLLNFKWAQLLEKFNYAPRILSKVNGISDNMIRRNSLLKYKEELLKEFEGKDVIDFYTGDILDKDDISIDHVIPWSFMYSDDIWNLVITSKSNNSKKSNSIPSNEIIEKLKIRNDNLEELLSDNFKLQMDEAIKNKYVDKFYFESRM